jgi:HEAT repeat protein
MLHDDPKDAPRTAAAAALGAFRGPDVEEALIRATRDGSTRVRIRTAQSLGKVGAGRAVAPLAGLVGDRSSRVKVAAAQSLSAIGSAEAAMALAASAEHGSWYTRGVALQALTALGPSAVPHLELLLDRVSRRRKGAVRQALGRAQPRS